MKLNQRWQWEIWEQFSFELRLWLCFVIAIVNRTKLFTKTIANGIVWYIKLDRIFLRVHLTENVNVEKHISRIVTSNKTFKQISKMTENLVRILVHFNKWRIQWNFQQLKQESTDLHNIGRAFITVFITKLRQGNIFIGISVIPFTGAGSMPQYIAGI